MLCILSDGRDDEALGLLLDDLNRSRWQGWSVISIAGPPQSRLVEQIIDTSRCRVLRSDPRWEPRPLGVAFLDMLAEGVFLRSDVGDEEDLLCVEASVRFNTDVSIASRIRVPEGKRYVSWSSDVFAMTLGSRALGRILGATSSQVFHQRGVPLARLAPRAIVEACVPREEVLPSAYPLLERRVLSAQIAENPTPRYSPGA